MELAPEVYILSSILGNYGKQFTRHKLIIVMFVVHSCRDFEILTVLELHVHGYLPVYF